MTHSKVGSIGKWKNCELLRVRDTKEEKNRVKQDKARHVWKTKRNTTENAAMLNRGNQETQYTWIHKPERKSWTPFPLRCWGEEISCAQLLRCQHDSLTPLQPDSSLTPPHRVWFLYFLLQQLLRSWAGWNLAVNKAKPKRQQQINGSQQSPDGVVT